MATGSLNPTPSQQWFDSAGRPLAGGTLAFYQAGTTTPQNVYADQGLTTPLTNPVVLDAGGRTPELFLSGTPYKEILKDSGGNTIFTADNIVAPLAVALSGNAAQFLNGNGAFAFPPSSYAIDATVGTVNDWLPSSGVVGNIYIYWTGATDLTITGLSAGAYSGQLFTIYNAGSGGNIYTLHNSSSSLQANRFGNYATSGPTPVSSHGAITYIYSTSVPGWRLIAHEQGAWITPAFSAANYSASGSMTWTVAAGNVQLDRYRLFGRTLSFSLWLNGGTLAGTGAATFTRGAYGYTAFGSGSVNNMAGVASVGVSATLVTATILANSTTIIFYHDLNSGAWPLGTTTVYANGSFEVT